MVSGEVNMPFVLLDDEEEEEVLPNGRFQILDDESIESQATKSGFGINDYPQPLESIASAGLGATQGALDLASLASLPLYPLQKLLGVSDDGTQTSTLPGREDFVKIQGDIIDKTNRGEAPSYGELMLLSDDDDLFPRSTGTLFQTLRNLEEKIPQTGETQEIARRATRSLPFALGGPASFGSALASEGAGLGARRAVEALGGGETAATIADVGAGLLGGFGASAFTRAPTASGIPAALENQGGLFAKAEIQGGRRLLDRNIQSIEQNSIRAWENNVSNLSRRNFNEFPQFQTSEIAQDLIRGNENAILNRISPVANESQAWRGIQQAITNGFESEASVYRPLYDQVRQGSRAIQHSATSTIDAVENGLARLRQVTTQAPGYQAAENILTTTIRDLGSNAQIPTYLRELERQGVNLGQPLNRPVPVSDLIELKVRLNDVRNYENLSPSIRDQVLEPVLQSLRREIRSGLSQSPPLENAFNQAEAAYQQTARRFNLDSIQRLRNSEAPETVANTFSRPSNLEALRNVLSPQDFQVAERQIVENLLRQNTDNARRSLQQIEGQLSNTAREAANQAIDLGDNLTSVGQRQILQRRILNDVQSALSDGTRPEVLLKAMKTPEGYSTARQLFNNSNTGREVFRTAEKQFMADVFDSVIKDNGRIDWEKASTLFTDPQIMRVVRAIGGGESISFLQRLSQYGYNFSRNLERFATKDPTWTNRLFGSLSTPAKTLLAGIAGSYFGLPGVITGIGSAQLLNAVMLKALSRPGIQQVIRTLGTTENYDRNDLQKLATRLNNYLTEESENGTELTE